MICWKLLKSGVLKKLLTVLNKTDYYNVLRDIKEDENFNVDFMECEVKLRTHYLKKFLKIVERILLVMQRKN